MACPIGIFDHSRDHNATSYSTETKLVTWTLYRDAEIITLRAIALKLTENTLRCLTRSRDHNATSYSTETLPRLRLNRLILTAEIITLRAIALKLGCSLFISGSFSLAEIITLRAIALKPKLRRVMEENQSCRDHNATSYSTETQSLILNIRTRNRAEIITLRAIALKQVAANTICPFLPGRDHNATSYSTET